MLTYQRIKQDLADQLQVHYRPGQRLPSIVRLAEQLGLGKTNTHRAVRELVRDGLLVSRPGQGTFLRDPERQRRVDPLAGQVRPLEGRYIGLVTVASTENMMILAAQSAAAWLEDQGAQTRIEMSKGTSIDDLRQAVNPLSPCDGLILLQADSVTTLPAAERTPTVLVTSSLPRGELRDGRFDLVTPNSYQGAMLAGQHLARIRCDHYLCVGVGRQTNEPGPAWDDISTERLCGFKTGLGDDHDVRMATVRTYEVDTTLAHVSPLLRQLSGTIGIFATSDDLAIGVGLAAIALGLTLGKDLHLVGFDGQQRGRRFTTGPLSTMNIPTERMGLCAARRLATRLLVPNDPTQHVQLPCAFYQGASTFTGDLSHG